MTNDVGKTFLSLKDAILLMAHRTTDTYEAERQHLSEEERKKAEMIAQEQLVEELCQDNIHATALFSVNKKKPMKSNWKTQQYLKPRSERIIIPNDDWKREHILKSTYWDMWMRIPDKQYSKIYVSVDDFKQLTNMSLLGARGQYGNRFLYKLVDPECEELTSTDMQYLPPYIILMFEAISEFQIDKNNQPLHETLVEWFETQEVDGKKVSNNEAKKLASFVRVPSAQKGGNRPWKA